MGKIKQGILGGFSGKTGAVVGSSWKGIAYMRGKAQSIKNPRTEIQQANRSLFGAVSDFASKILFLLNMGFVEKAVKMSGFNYFVKTNLLNEAFGLTDGNLTLTANKLELAGGTLTGVTMGAVLNTEGTLTCSMTTQSRDCYGVLVAINSSTLEVDFAVSPLSTMTSTAVSLPTKASWATDSVYVYTFAFLPTERKANDSAYKGEINLGA